MAFNIRQIFSFSNGEVIRQYYIYTYDMRGSDIKPFCGLLASS